MKLPINYIETHNALLPLTSLDLDKSLILTFGQLSISFDLIFASFLAFLRHGFNLRRQRLQLIAPNLTVLKFPLLKQINTEGSFIINSATHTTITWRHGINYTRHYVLTDSLVNVPRSPKEERRQVVCLRLPLSDYNAQKTHHDCNDTGEWYELPHHTLKTRWIWSCYNTWGPYKLNRYIRYRRVGGNLYYIINQVLLDQWIITYPFRRFMTCM